MARAITQRNREARRETQSRGGRLDGTGTGPGYGAGVRHCTIRAPAPSLPI